MQEELEAVEWKEGATTIDPNLESLNENRRDTSVTNHDAVSKFDSTFRLGIMHYRCSIHYPLDPMSCSAIGYTVLQSISRQLTN